MTFLSWCQLEIGGLLRRTHAHPSHGTGGKKGGSSCYLPTACLQEMLSRNGAAEGTQQVRPVQCHLAELGSVNEEHLRRVTRAPHHILTAGPAAERKRMLTQGIRRGDLQSISGNEERAVGRQAGRWRLTTNGAEVLQRKRFQQPCGDPRCGEKTVKATNLPPPRLHW